MRTSGIFLSLLAAYLVACGGSTRVGTAGTCFNPELYETGTSIQTSSLKTYTGLGSEKLGNSIRVDGLSSFNGNVVVKTSEVDTITPDAALVAIGSQASTGSISRYFQSDNLTLRLKLYGDESKYSSVLEPNNYFTSKTSNRPYIEMQFDLIQGESFTQFYEQNSIFEQPNGESVEFTGTYTKRILFSGVEDITVPAGTFQACKFIETGSVTYTMTSLSIPTDTLTKWVGVRSGILVKSLTESVSTPAVTVELTSAAINGTAVTP